MVIAFCFTRSKAEKIRFITLKSIKPAPNTALGIKPGNQRKERVSLMNSLG